MTDLEAVIYGALMHHSKPKTVSDFERAARTVAEMLERRQSDELERLRAQVAELGAFLRSRDATIVEQNKQLNQFRVMCAAQAEAAWAVVKRWDSPDWKDAKHTADYINALRQAITAAPAQQAGQAPAPEPGRAKLVAELMMMVGRYWDIAYVEGKEGRLHDTPAGDAQRALSAIYEAAKHLAGVTPCAAVKPEPIGYLSEHTGPDGPFKWQFSKTLAGVYLDTALRIIPVYEPPVQAQGAHP